jgi:hypothetical protein
MRKAIIAAAAACMVMGSTRADTEPTNFVRIVTYVVTATGAVKAAFEVYDWVTARWFPPPQQFQAGDLWLCGNCQFPPPSRGSTPDDDYLGSAFIAQQFAGRTFYAGQSLVLCDPLQCFMFRYDGEQWFASGPSFKNPGVGYANTPPPAATPPAAPAPRRGGGETGAPHAPRSSTVWSPNVVYNPGSRPFGTGTVTVIPGPGVTFGGGGGGFGGFGGGGGGGFGGFGGGGGSHFIGPLPHD